MSDAVRRLLDRIVDRFVVDDEMRTIDRDAANSPDGVAIETDKQQASRRETERHEQLGPAFERGLVRAWERERMGGHELMLDDRNPEQNAMADALIQLLVRFDLAASRTETTADMHYTYNITIDWPKLRSLSEDIDVKLDDELRHLVERASR